MASTILGPETEGKKKKRPESSMQYISNRANHNGLWTTHTLKNEDPNPCVPEEKLKHSQVYTTLNKWRSEDKV